MAACYEMHSRNVSNFAFVLQITQTTNRNLSNKPKEISKHALLKQLASTLACSLTNIKAKS